MPAASSPHVLVLSRSYPTPVRPTLGIWVERLARAAAGSSDIEVIAPVPYLDELRYPARPRAPAAPGDPRIRVHHPRVFAPPRYLVHALEARMQRGVITRVARRLAARRPFHLIHAHFIYPEGVIAAALGARLGVPVLTTEHALWQPWLSRYPAIRRQVERALRQIHTISAVSDAVLETIRPIARDQVRLALLPNVLDDRVFVLPPPGDPVWNPNRLLFVGVVRRVKGLDVLIRALPLLLRHRPDLELTIVGEPFFRGYRRDDAAVRALVRQLAVADHVRFVGHASPPEVARHMRESAVLVVPSRRESFSSVTIEALASGTPVVATRCGGPEELILPGTGELVPPDDPHALAAAILRVLDRRPGIDPAMLRASVIQRFGWTAATHRVERLYRSCLRKST